MSFSIAIDGPAGAGKSTVARCAAQKLGFVYVDTGAMYRTIALYMLEHKVDVENQNALEEALSQIEIGVRYQDGMQQMLLNGVDVSGRIRTQEVSDQASVTAAKPAVREKLLNLQRELARHENVIMDGRDIGTRILPDAPLKIFLTASSRERARRRYAELQQKGESCSLEEIQREIEERDDRDSHRAEAPLRQADDAILLDTSDLSVEEAVDRIVNLAETAMRDAKRKEDARRGIHSPEARIQELKNLMKREDSPLKGQLWVSDDGKAAVYLAASAGFCFGVHRAVDTVYDQIKEGQTPICTYGPIIHNEMVVADLKQHGVMEIDDEAQLSGITEGTVVIRSHGVPERIYEQIKGQGLKLVDATCPYVKKIHQIVKEKSAEGFQIVIIGNAHHPEVEGIMGWCSSPAIVIGTEEEAQKLVESGIQKPLCVVSQTTFNLKKFHKLVEIITQLRYHESAILNTICNATEERQTEADAIAHIADAMIVIGGRNSSNTQKLVDICRKECESTFFVQTFDDLNLRLVPSRGIVGISAGASTPNNIIEEVSKQCRKTILLNRC